MIINNSTNTLSIKYYYIMTANYLKKNINFDGYRSLPNTQ